GAGLRHHGGGSGGHRGGGKGRGARGRYPPRAHRPHEALPRQGELGPLRPGPLPGRLRLRHPVAAREGDRRHRHRQLRGGGAPVRDPRLPQSLPRGVHPQHGPDIGGDLQSGGAGRRLRRRRPLGVPARGPAAPRHARGGHADQTVRDEVRDAAPMSDSPALQWMRPRGHQVAVLWSRGSRDAYAAEAAARGETYTFTDARGNPRTWLKGEWAYLAPNAASLLLARCNLKHDVVEEAQLTDESLAGYRALLIPDAGHLAAGTAERIERWLRGGDRRLIVAGKTNLPARLLGLNASAPAPVTGYTGWQWLPGSPFASADWEPRYVTGYAGHGASRVTPLPGSRVLADLVELTGDLTTADTATVTRLGPAVVLTERTAYIANPVFELLGGMLQAHLNVEAVRHWANPTHWGDTIVFFLRRILLEAGLEPLWQTRLRSFGTYDGVLSFRHDVHGALDFDFLDYQIQNLIAASYDIEDPAHSTNISEAQAAEWVARTTRHSFIEPALHNDSSIGDPPVAIRGAGLYEHVRSAAANLGFPVYTGGRHAGGHMHPETLDAMDYLYAMDERILGLCTFCYYHMIEYGVRHPDVMAGGAIGGKPLTYVTDVRRTIATPGIWFPFHPVVTTDAEWRPLRGWDRTHEYDAAYELVETIFGGHSARRPGVDDHLENGVYSFQYHPELARDPSINDGK